MWRDCTKHCFFCNSPFKTRKKHVIPSHRLNEFYSEYLKAFSPVVLAFEAVMAFWIGLLLVLLLCLDSVNSQDGEAFSLTEHCGFLLFLWFTSSMWMFELKEQRCGRWRSRWGMWITFCLTGLTHLLQIIVSGEGLRVIMSLTMWLHCKYHSYCSWVVYAILRFNKDILFIFSLFFFFRNLSGLNLEGEISPALGRLSSLVSMYYYFTF